MPRIGWSPNKFVALVDAEGDTHDKSNPLMTLAYDPMSYYSSAAGGRRAFAVPTGYETIPAGVDQQFCAFVNPANSGMDVYLDVGEFSSSVDTMFKRLSVASTGITVTGSPIIPNNLSGGSLASVARLYDNSGTYTAAGGVVSKVAFMKGHDTYFTYLYGRSILRPGRALYWTVDGKGSGITASIYLEWWELPAET